MITETRRLRDAITSAVRALIRGESLDRSTLNSLVGVLGSPIKPFHHRFDHDAIIGLTSVYDIIPDVPDRVCVPMFFNFKATISTPYIVSASTVMKIITPRTSFGSSSESVNIGDAMVRNWTFVTVLNGGNDYIDSSPVQIQLHVPAASDVINTISKSGTAPAGSGYIVLQSGAATYAGLGSGAEFLIRWSGGAYIVDVIKRGNGFGASETLVFDGTQFGGTSPANDLTVTVLSVANVTEDVIGGGAAGNALDVTLYCLEVDV